MKPGWISIGLFIPIDLLGRKVDTITLRPIRADDLRLIDSEKVKSQFGLMSMLTEPSVSVEELSMLTFPADLPRMIAVFLAHIPPELRAVVTEMPSFDVGYGETQANSLPSQDVSSSGKTFDPFPKSLDDKPLMDEPMADIPGTFQDGEGDFTLPE